MEQNDEKELREIIGGLACSKDFMCYKSGFKNASKAIDVGLESYLECQEGCPLDCSLSVSFGGLHYCRCPLHIYIVKKLNK
jgi:hypothetical protein